jgi:hypothetical protein
MIEEAISEGGDTTFNTGGKGTRREINSNNPEEINSLI